MPPGDADSTLLPDLHPLLRVTFSPRKRMPKILRGRKLIPAQGRPTVSTLKLSGLIVGRPFG